MYSINALGFLIRDSDGMGIPVDPQSFYYQQFLEWQAAGNSPAPYEPPAALPQPNYIGFSDALLASGAYQKIRAQGMTSTALAYAATEFSFSMTDAKAGRPNVAALQACLASIAATATDLDAADWAEIGGLLEAHGLHGLYQLPEAAAGGSGSGG
jgi:hypothetical protein